MCGPPFLIYAFRKTPAWAQQQLHLGGLFWPGPVCFVLLCRLGRVQIAGVTQKLRPQRRGLLSWWAPAAPAISQFAASSLQSCSGRAWPGLCTQVTGPGPGLRVLLWEKSPVLSSMPLHRLPWALVPLSSIDPVTPAELGGQQFRWGVEGVGLSCSMSLGPQLEARAPGVGLSEGSLAHAARGRCWLHGPLA